MYRSLAFQINTSNTSDLYFLLLHTYIHTSTYFILIRLSEAETVSLVRKPSSTHRHHLYWEHAKAKSSTHRRHLFWEHAKAFPGQRGSIVPPAWPESATRSPPGWLCLKHLAREAPKRHVLQLLEPPRAPGLSGQRGAALLLYPG